MVLPAGVDGRVSCSGTSNFLFGKRKLPKKTTQTYGLSDPFGAGRAGANLAVCTRGRGAAVITVGQRTVPAFTGAEASATAWPSHGRGYLLLPDWRLSNRAFAALRRQGSVPVGHRYNYFLACDTAERIIFTIVTGSGSGKLCWHSRGTDNDQENAGYVRESAGGSEQA